MALWQHFSYYLNRWYIDYFKEVSSLPNTFSFHAPFVDKALVTDPFSTWAAWFFTSWVSQVYLFLAAFNLGKRDQIQFGKVFKTKLASFGIIFFLFFSENFLVAPNIGEALSFYPIMCWMVVLSIIAISFRFFGPKSIVVLFALSYLRFLLPLDSIHFYLTSELKSLIHYEYEIDARLDYFFGSGALGFILGRIAFSKGPRSIDWFKWGMAIGVVLVILGGIFAGEYQINSADVFENEHLYASGFWGSQMIYGVEIFLISLVFWLKEKGIQLRLPIINYIGKYSLIIFLFHRILFVKVFLPLRELFSNWTHVPLQNVFWETWIYILLVVLICYGTIKSRLLEMLAGKK